MHNPIPRQGYRESLTKRCIYTIKCNMDETITIRMSADLKSAVEQAAASRGMTLAGWVKRALEESLAPPYRVTQIPGLDPSFDTFIERLRSQQTSPRVLVLVDEGQGNRYVCIGFIDFRKTSDS